MEVGVERVERRLAAIMAADVAGYSRLMEADEVGTLHALVCRREIMDALIADFGGRIANTAGDSVLAEFPSAVKAVECAIEMQQRLQSGLPEPRLLFRIGVHVGDVMVRGNDLLGDGVNIAARLQALAEPGAVCISSAAHGYVRRTLALPFVDLGEQRVKNIEEPIRALALAPVLTPSTMTTSGHPSLALPDRPSIAVVPFTNASADPEQDYFADGVVEDIITALSRVRWLFVTARNSTLAYKGQVTDVKRIGRELGVRYVLQGRIRRAGSRLRITAQLVDAESGGPIWTERYDRDLSDLFEMQDEITASVVGAIEPQLVVAEVHRIERKLPNDLKAWDCSMRALPHLWRMTVEETAKAQEWLGRAIEIDPDYAYAHALLAFSYMRLWGLVGTDQHPGLLRSAERHARAAALLDEQEPWVYLVLGWLHSRRREPEEAILALTRSISLNPNFAMAHAHLGYALGMGGQPRAGLEALERAVRLSPRDPFLANDYLSIRGMTSFAAGDYREAIRMGRRLIQDRPDHIGAHRILAASYALLDRMDEAKSSLREVLRIHSGATLTEVERVAQFSDPEVRLRYIEGLRKAGLPD